MKYNNCIKCKFCSLGLIRSNTNPSDIIVDPICYKCYYYSPSVHVCLYSHLNGLSKYLTSCGKMKSMIRRPWYRRADIKIPNPESITDPQRDVILKMYRNGLPSLKNIPTEMLDKLTYEKSTVYQSIKKELVEERGMQ